MPLVVGDSLHQDHSSAGLVLRSHPGEHVGLELCQPLGIPPAPVVTTSLGPSLGLHLLAGDREPMGWVAGSGAASPPEELAVSMGLCRALPFRRDTPRGK